MHDPVRELTLDELPRPPFTGCMKLSRGRLVLACDVDSTVWNLSAWLCEAVLDVTGEPLDPEAVNTWANVLEAYDESAVIEIYTRALSSHRVREREPYTGTTKALRCPQEERDIQIPFTIRTYEGCDVPHPAGRRGEDMRFELAGWQKLNLARRSRHFGGGWHS